MANIGPMEIIVVLIIALVVFGPKKLPELGKSLGKGINEFKGSISGMHDGRTEPTVAAEPAAVAAPAPVAAAPTPVVAKPVTAHRIEEPTRV
jgi:sec-independent protein translocase protein TatA